MHKIWILAACLALFTAEAKAQPFAYVLGQPQTDAAAGTVTVIDTSSPFNLIMTVITVGANCVCAAPDSMAMAPDGSRLYVTNQRGNSVSVINTTSNTVIATIPVGSGPVGAASGGILTVTWGLGPGVAPSAHLLNFYQGGTPVASVTTGAGSSAQIVIPPGVAGTFTVTVTAVSTATLGPPPVPAAFTIGECVPPPAVTGLMGGVVAGTGSVTWNPSPGATAYIVLAGVSQGGAELFNANIGNALSVSASGLPSGFTAWVRVFATNACGTSAPQDVLVQ